MKILYIDCFSGIAGDMMLGGLLDLGVPKDYLLKHLEPLNLGDWSMQVDRVSRHHIGGVDVKIKQPAQTDSRHWVDIRALIESSDLPQSARELSIKIFGNLAQAEAKIHNQDVEHVHFHEVGAIDAIVDICGTALGLDYLKIDQVISAPVPMPRGWIQCEHGSMPLPAPATAALLCGAKTQSVQATGEWVTPTGAAILKSVCTSYGEIPSMEVQAIGYGAGDADPDDRPNLLRLILGESGAQNNGNELDLLIQTNIDDMSAELFSHVCESLFQAGAVDVWTTPIQMKKGRPGVMLSAICAPEHKTVIIDTLLLESTAIGMR
ncbi:MAG TPA: nickel pincer cofactor biosynthesis protein LarC, partial [Myxococcales bacterium]|nr:nickel pincer cofactor biosynthesis protein LarC [Myxococcales bacterium]